MNQFRHDRIGNLLCTKCGLRNVKKPPRTCLNPEDYQHVHKLCKPCWKDIPYYDKVMDREKNKVMCWFCISQPCWYCKNLGGVWQEDIKKVLCAECL